MLKNIDYVTARDVMLGLISVISQETAPLSETYGRVLAQELTAKADVPPFDRSPFDGYAIRIEDTRDASRDNPVRLRVIDEVPAGGFPGTPVTAGTAIKILTGAPIPDGADGTVKFEQTEFTADTVTFFAPVTVHDIIRRGEDVKRGENLAKPGDRIDSALMGTLAAQGVICPSVYKQPKIGIVSTGSELVSVGDDISKGKIRDTNTFMIAGAVQRIGAVPVCLGTAGDTAEEISALLRKGLSECDAVISTGGVSVGDYDVTPAAMELAGAELAVRKIQIQPGGACAYGVSGGKVIFGLSGNPMAAMVNFNAVVLPCLKKLMGLADYMYKPTIVTLAEDFNKPSPVQRLLRGRLDLSTGEVLMRFSGQGNAMLHAAVGCDVLAVIPAGSGKLTAGTKLNAFMI